MKATLPPFHPERRSVVTKWRFDGFSLRSWELGINKEDKSSPSLEQLFLFIVLKTNAKSRKCAPCNNNSCWWWKRRALWLDLHVKYDAVYACIHIYIYICVFHSVKVLLQWHVQNAVERTKHPYKNPFPDGAFVGHQEGDRHMGRSVPQWNSKTRWHRCLLRAESVRRWQCGVWCRLPLCPTS